MANSPNRITVDGVEYPVGTHGTPLNGKTNEKMRAQIMRKSFNADTFHRHSRRVHGTDFDYRVMSGDHRA